MKRITHVLILGSALCVSVVRAAEYNQVRLDKTSLAFAYQQMGVQLDGHFNKFGAQIAFDPSKPLAATVKFTVDIGSIDTGSSEGDQEVAGKSWFNTKAFPTASFVSASVKPLGGGRYDVAGTLTIKGQAREVVVPTTVTVQGSSAVFDGSFVIHRGNFAIGEGAWAKFDVVANDVRIRFHLIATGK